MAESKPNSLAELREQIARFHQLEARTGALRAQRQELTRKVDDLQQKKLDEQADVDRLEGGRSLAAFFYGVIGKMDQKLTRERREAYEARVKYDAAARELAAVEDALARDEAELRQLSGCEKNYRQALDEKARTLREKGGPAAERLTGLEKELAEVERQKKELREALDAGETALRTADEILARLASAEDWATIDLVGGGFLSGMAKHSRLDEAQELVEQLQVELRRFKTELVDVSVDTDLQIEIDGFLRFADYFFDGLFADWAVMDRIDRSQEQAGQTRRQIQSVIDRLNEQLRQAGQKQTALQKEYDESVFQA